MRTPAPYHTVLTEHNKIFATVYGQRKPTEGTDLPDLWVYRPRVTLDHLPQMLPYKDITAKHRMLHLFLIMVCHLTAALYPIASLCFNILWELQEPNLRATKYIPDLQQLQQRLHDRFHHRIDAQQAASLTLGEFLEQENGTLQLQRGIILCYMFITSTLQNNIQTCLIALNGHGV